MQRGCVEVTSTSYSSCRSDSRHPVLNCTRSLRGSQSLSCSRGFQQRVVRECSILRCHNSSQPVIYRRRDIPLAAAASLSAAAELQLQFEAYASVFSPEAVELPPTRVEAPGRIIAIGDIHGDINKAIAAFEMAGVLGQGSQGEVVWIGANTTVVQLGDVLDRGDFEIGTIQLIRELDRQARFEGGAVYMLNGNHESLNVCTDFRYVTPGAFVESGMAAGLQGADLTDKDLLKRARAAIYSPGGLMAKELAKNPTVLVVNKTIFAHGAVLPIHVKYGLEKINADVSSWMCGTRNSDGSRAAPPFLAMGDAQSVMWNRCYGKEKFPIGFSKYNACRQLEQMLASAGAAQLIVGHTPQVGGANCECDGRVWRIDVGMSSGVLNAMPQVLEIVSSPTGQTVTRVVSYAPGYHPSLQMGVQQMSGAFAI